MLFPVQFPAMAYKGDTTVSGKFDTLMTKIKQVCENNFKSNWLVDQSPIYYSTELYAVDNWLNLITYLHQLNFQALLSTYFFKNIYLQMPRYLYH